MQGTFLDQLLRAISDKRLDSYRQPNNNGVDLKCFASYAWNAALSESLCSSLQGLEVTLRNSIHDAATTCFGSDSWFLGEAVQLDPLGQRMLASVKMQLKNDNKPPLPENFVSGFSLGFWVNLFNRNYEQRARHDQRLWPRLLQEVFPYIPRHERVRTKLWSRLDQIRKLRNRIFHYEPIWHWNRLPLRHDEVLETIQWMNPAMLDMVQMLDRFPEVHRMGVQKYETALSQMMERIDLSHPDEFQNPAS